MTALFQRSRALAEGSPRVCVRQPLAALLPGVMLCLTLALSTSARAATAIEIWHDLRGPGSVVFTDLIARFNASQDEVRVEAVFKGGERASADNDAAAAALQAWRGKRALPTLVQVADDRGEAILAAKGLARPLDALLSAAPVKPFLPDAVSFANGPRGEAWGFPLEITVPLFFYNRDAYRSAGLDADAPPRTWRDLQAHLLALKNAPAAVDCAYTTSEQAWIHVENLGAWHGENISAARAKGAGGTSVASGALNFNGLLHVRHTALMMSWLKSQLFTYSGRRKEGDARFASGECATLSSASTALADVMADARFSWGVAPMPYHEEGTAQGVGSIAGGSALWLTAGRKPAEYQAVARFLAWFASAPVAGEWSRRTGSLPLTAAAWQDTLATGNAGLAPLLRGLSEGDGVARRVRASLRLTNHERVRDVIDSQLEAVWNGSKAAKQGLDDAVRLGNLAMKDARREPGPVRPLTRTGYAR